jgi:2-polyprenyl-6-methoxyphenol hydroxylase-like FAD-dependent oxidoreductase
MATLSQPHSSGPRVLVVGAGPTGLALACELHRANVPCRVIDAAIEHGTRSKGIAIWPRSLEILRDLGIADEAAERGLPVRGGSLWSQGRRLTSFDLAGLDSRYGWGLVLPQPETEELLERRLVELGGKVEKGVRLVQARTSSSGLPTVTLESADGHETTEVDWLVGCDGPASQVRADAGIAMPGKLEQYGWLLADVRLHTELPRNWINWFLHANAVLHVLPMPGDQWRLTMTVGAQRPDPAEWPMARVQQLVAARSPVPITLTSLEWLSGFRVRQGIAARFRSGRVLLAGDAAHVHSPAGAQGVNAALQDAVNLGWKLAKVCRGEAPDVLLDSYDAERRPAASLTVLMADRMTKGATLGSRFARSTRDRLWSNAGRRGVVQRALPPLVSGVRQGHPAGLVPASAPRLVARHARGLLATVVGRPYVGARLPDPLLDGSGPDAPRRLWDLWPAGTPAVLAWAGRDKRWDEVDGFTALHRAVPRDVPVIVFESPGVPADAIPDAPAWRVVPDYAGVVRRSLHAGPDTAVVVRPDRYLGGIGRASTPAAIRAYFQTVGGAC